MASTHPSPLNLPSPARLAEIALSADDDQRLESLFTRYETVSRRGLTADGVRHIFHKRLQAAGYPPGYASPHGLRSGFITEALSRDVPLAQVMRLTLHKSAEQVLEYHDEKQLEKNPGLDLM